MNITQKRLFVGVAKTGKIDERGWISRQYHAHIACEAHSQSEILLRHGILDFASHRRYAIQSADKPTLHCGSKAGNGSARGPTIGEFLLPISR